MLTLEQIQDYHKLRYKILYLLKQYLSKKYYPSNVAIEDFLIIDVNIRISYSVKDRFDNMVDYIEMYPIDILTEENYPVTQVNQQNEVFIQGNLF